MQFQLLKKHGKLRKAFLLAEKGKLKVTKAPPLEWKTFDMCKQDILKININAISAKKETDGVLIPKQCDFNLMEVMWHSW